MLISWYSVYVSFLFDYILFNLFVVFSQVNYGMFHFCTCSSLVDLADFKILCPSKSQVIRVLQPFSSVYHLLNSVMYSQGSFHAK